MFLFCGEEAVDEVFFVFVLCEVRHALHELLDCIASGDGKVVEFIKSCQMWVLAEQLVERGYLSDLESVNGLRGDAHGVDIQRRSTASHFRRSAAYRQRLCLAP